MRVWLPSDSDTNGKAQDYTVQIPPLDLEHTRWECAVEKLIYSTAWKSRPHIIHVWLDLLFQPNVVDQRRHRIIYSFVPGPDSATFHLSEKPQGLIWHPVELNQFTLRSIRVQLLNESYEPIDYTEGKTSVKLNLQPI